jgi:TolA-binding protein
MLVHTLAALLALSGCQSAPPPPAPIQPAAAEPVAAAPAAAVAEPIVATDPELEARMEDLELELTQLKLVIDQMQQAGIGSMDAEHVSYQPNRTTLRARTVQDAVDELWADLHREELGQDNPGAAGEGLFDLENGPLGPQLTTEEREQRMRQYKEQQRLDEELRQKEQ